MGERRIDQIGKLIKKRGGRATVRDLLEQLKKKENNKKLQVQAIYRAIQQENQRFKRLGDSPPFRTRSEGEERGYVSLSRGTVADREREIVKLIDVANQEVDRKFRDWLQSMQWRTFESNFLVQLLEALGFEDIKITAQTKDGGYDAIASYQNGDGVSKAIIQAKHWNKGVVPVREVRELRGIGGSYDTAIIVATTKFTRGAKEEAERREPHERHVVLIDLNQLIETCKQKGIGVVKKPLPELLELDSQSDASADIDVDVTAVSNGRNVSGGAIQKIKTAPRSEARKIIKRLRDEMLDELTTKQIAYLSGFAENTVRNYRSTDPKSLGNAIRKNPDKREKALEIIGRNRHQGR